MFKARVAKLGVSRECLLTSMEVVPVDMITRIRFSTKRLVEDGDLGPAESDVEVCTIFTPYAVDGIDISNPEDVKSLRKMLSLI